MLLVNQHIGFGVGGLLPSKLIESVQEFEIIIGSGSTSGTATISAVDTSRSIVIWNGTRVESTTINAKDFARLQLTDATTVTATRSTSGDNNGKIRGTVITFKAAAVSRVQQGTISVSNGTGSNTATITSVDTSRSAAFFLHQSIANANYSHCEFRIDLTNATTVTAERQGSSGDSVVAYAVVEFASGVVKSVQKASIQNNGSSSTSLTATISAVDTSNTWLVWNNFKTDYTSGDNFSFFWYKATLTNSTTITITRVGTNSGGNTTYYFTAIEFNPGVLDSIQLGTATIASSSLTGNATVTSVDTTKAVASYLGAAPASTTDPSAAMTTISLTSATNVQGKRENNPSLAVDCNFDLIANAA